MNTPSKDECDPKLFPELKTVNTVICEQINYWLGKYKFIMKHMNVFRFNFFLYIISNEYNKIKVNGKFNNINVFKLEQTNSKKRKYEEIDSEDSDE